MNWFSGLYKTWQKDSVIEEDNVHFKISKVLQQIDSLLLLTFCVLHFLCRLNYREAVYHSNTNWSSNRVPNSWVNFGKYPKMKDNRTKSLEMGLKKAEYCIFIEFLHKFALFLRLITYFRLRSSLRCQVYYCYLKNRHPSEKSEHLTFILMHGLYQNWFVSFAISQSSCRIFCTISGIASTRNVRLFLFLRLKEYLLWLSIRTVFLSFWSKDILKIYIWFKVKGTDYKFHWYR